MGRLFSHRVPDPPTLPCENEECRRQVPRVEPDPDKDRYRDATNKLAEQVHLLRSGDTQAFDRRLDLAVERDLLARRRHGDQ